MNRVLFDLAALISRVTIGVIFVAHGWQKWQNGLDATTAMFTQVGVPMPEVAAGFTTVAETVGGAFLILGLLTRLAALCLLVVSVGAIAYVHSWNGLFIANNGWELVGALAAACLLFVALGAGRISIDGIFRAMFGKRKEEPVAPPVSAAPEPAAVKLVDQPATAELPRQREQQATTPAPAVPDPRTTQTGQDWSEQELKDIDALFADDKKPPTG